MWNDNETSEDLIDFQYLKDSINGIIDQDHLLPSTIGVFGDWGSGKSSLIKMIEDEHQKKTDQLIIKFNGWLFEGYEDAKVALLETLIEEIIKARKWDKKTAKYISRLVDRVKWLKVASSVSKNALGVYLAVQTGMSLESFGVLTNTFDVNDYVEKETEEKEEQADKGIRGFHKDFSTLIEEAKLNRVIVIIDDLDRCTPSTVISTLEAIKLFLFVEKTVFIIAADERLINYAVKSKFPNLPSSDYDVSQDYLEKLIQIPIRIPALNQIEYETYINLLFAKKTLDNHLFNGLLTKISTAHKDPYTSRLNSDNLNTVLDDPCESLKEDILLTKLLSPLLVQVLRGNPRQCKRFLNMLSMRIDMSKAKGIDLKKTVLAKLMLLEYFKPESFQSLVKEIATSDDNIFVGLESQTSELSPMLETFKNDEWINRWLAIEPKLAKEDLTGYLYFIRSKILNIKQSKRLTKEAKNILIEMLEKDLISKAAVKKSVLLPEEDKTGILEELIDRYHQAQDNKIRSNLSGIISSFVKENANLHNEYLAFLNNLPVNNVVSSMIPQLVGVTNDPELSLTKKAILTKWSKSGITAIAKPAENKLSKLQ